MIAATTIKTVIFIIDDEPDLGVKYISLVCS